MRSGTLVASSTFRDANGTLLTIGAGDRGCNAPGTPGIMPGTCNRLVDISHVTLDAGRYAYGGLLINHTMDVNIGPAIMIVGYTGAGISLPDSGATFIQHAWLGAIAPGSPTPRANATGTAILLSHGQHDAMVEDIIIFSGMVGVRSENGANRILGVHAWNLAGSDGGIGIELAVPWWKQKAGVSGGRVQNCYLDYAPLVVRHPGNLVVTDNLFLGSSAIVLAPVVERFEVRDVIITNNVHHTDNRGNASFVIDESVGSFAAATDVTVTNNEVDAADARANKTSTRAELTRPLAPGDASARLLWAVPALLLGRHRQGVDPLLALRPARDRDERDAARGAPHTVRVTLAQSVPSHLASGDVRVTCAVDQSARACPAGERAGRACSRCGAAGGAVPPMGRFRCIQI